MKVIFVDYVILVVFVMDLNIVGVGLGGVIFSILFGYIEIVLVGGFVIIVMGIVVNFIVI